MLTRTTNKCLDGSHTLYSKSFGENYHSLDGAISESIHVYIKSGLNYFLEHYINERSENPASLHILEMGMGSGLNVLLTLMEISKLQSQTGMIFEVYYKSYEKYPLLFEEYSLLNHPQLVSDYYGADEVDIQRIFDTIHTSPWSEKVKLSDMFFLEKVNSDIYDITEEERFDIIYWDAFSPNTQPELWSEEILNRVASIMRNNSVLTTYCSKGSVKQNLRSTGLTIQRIKGAGNKRHMIRAIKNTQYE